MTIVEGETEEELVAKISERTAMIAALATGEPAAITVAFSHLLFNLSGTLLIYLPPPIRAIPIFLAERMGALGASNRVLAGVYILVMFYGLPLLLLFLTGTFRGSEAEPADSRLRVPARIEQREPYPIAAERFELC